MKTEKKAEQWAEKQLAVLFLCKLNVKVVSVPGLNDVSVLASRRRRSISSQYVTFTPSHSFFNKVCEVEMI